MEIDRLAREAADPVEAGQKMRQVYFTQVKLTNRQLTVDLLRKFYDREIGTHEVAQLAKKVIKGESRRNPKINQKLKLKLEDALKSKKQIMKQNWAEKKDLYRVINRRGLLKEEFWSSLRLNVERMWRKGKEKNQNKADRLERVYKGAKPYTGMVDNIRIGDDELGEEEESGEKDDEDIDNADNQ